MIIGQSAGCGNSSLPRRRKITVSDLLLSLYIHCQVIKPQRFAQYLDPGKNTAVIFRSEEQKKSNNKKHYTGASKCAHPRDALDRPKTMVGNPPKKRRTIEVLGIGVKELKTNQNKRRFTYNGYPGPNHFHSYYTRIFQKTTALQKFCDVISLWIFFLFNFLDVRHDCRAIYISRVKFV